MELATLTCCRLRQIEQQVACLLQSSRPPALLLQLVVILLVLLLVLCCWPCTALQLHSAHHDTKGSTSVQPNAVTSCCRQ